MIKKALELRETTDKTLYYVDENLVKIIEKKVPTEYVIYSRFLKFEEIDQMKLPSLRELKKRKKGFIFYDNEVYTDLTKKIFAEKNNLWFNNKLNKNKIIKGETGFSGNVKGIAKVIYQEDQMGKIKKGDILISPMTTPNFLPAIKKASAIVTDEGGITCHAAIVSRELKIPCIIGTNNATIILKDGDLIEIDAEKGIVKILKKS